MQCDLTFNQPKFETLPIFIKRALFVRYDFSSFVELEFKIQVENLF